MTQREKVKILLAARRKIRAMQMKQSWIYIQVNKKLGTSDINSSVFDYLCNGGSVKAAVRWMND